MTSDISLGTILGERYEILSELGRGRVGIVYKATHRRLNKPLAVKVLFEDIGKDATSMKRFELEARSSACLSHPNIIDVLDFGFSSNGYPYLVMEFIDGKDLHASISLDGRFNLVRTLRVATQLCHALSHAHDRGVVHRDLKPSNVMLQNSEGYPDLVKLVDFGIAKKNDGIENVERLTMEGQVLGTPAYMSPEQCQAHPLDARSDIYSLGCVIFKMLTGQAPISGSNIIEIIHNHISGEPLSFAAANPDVRVPPAIQEVIMTALEKDPARRHQTMFEFGALLQNAFDISGVSTPASSMPALTTASVSASASFPALNPFAGIPNPFTTQQSSQSTGTAFSGGSGVYPSLSQGQTPGTYSVDPAADIQLTPAPISPISSTVASMPVITDEAAAVYKGRKLESLIENANQGDARAQYELFSRFQSGDGVGSSNQEEAMRWLLMAAESGHAEAQYRLGRRLLDGSPQQAMQGLTWLQRAADKKYPPAFVVVATCFEEGRGCAPDYPLAAHYYRLAVKSGNQHALAKLSACYQHCFELGLEAEGFSQWLQQRAEQGDVDSLFILTLQASRVGGAVPFTKQVVPHLLGPAQQGNVRAQLVLAQILFASKEPEDQKQGFFWISKAATGGNRDALVQLAGAYKTGSGVTKDPQQAAQLLQQASELGQLDAQAILGSLLLVGDDIPRNLTRGITMLRQAANSGSGLAHWKFALCLKNGLGTVRDNKEAEKWFEKAAESKFDQGPFWKWAAPGLRFDEAIATFRSLAQLENRQAYYWLGICYENGIGMPQDQNKALDNYTRSANRGYTPAQEALAKLKAALGR